jgi:hypothetical protein
VGRFVGRGAPVVQRGAELVEELAAFVEEDRQQVGVELVAQLGRGRGRPGSGLRAWRPGRLRAG